MFSPPPGGRLGWIESHPGLVTLNLRTEIMSTPEAVEVFVGFFYNGKLEITPHIVLPLIYLSEKYDVPFVNLSAKSFLLKTLEPRQAVDLVGIAMGVFGASFGVGGFDEKENERKEKGKEDDWHLGDWMLGKCVHLIERDSVAALDPSLILPPHPPELELAEYLLSSAKLGKAPEILLFRWAVAVRSALLSWGGGLSGGGDGKAEDEWRRRADSLLLLIRFRLMSADEQKSEVTSSGLVSKEVIEKALATIEDSSQQHARLKRRRGGWWSPFVGEMSGWTL